MFANGGIKCQVSKAEIKPWFYSQKSTFFALKPKTQCIGRKELGFFHPWEKVMKLPNKKWKTCKKLLTQENTTLVVSMSNVSFDLVSQLSTECTHNT